MRRYTVYFLIALLAFGIGACFVYVENLRDVDTVDEIVKPSPGEQKQITSQKPKNIDFKCENRYLLAVWNHLQKDSNYRQLFDNEREIADCSEIFGVSETVDLNNDGEKEVVVNANGWLNGVFNSSFWIVLKIENDYKIILEGKDSEYEPKNQTTNGFFDIKITTKWSSGERNLLTYQFNGSDYVPKKCYLEYDWVLRNDEKIQLEKPMISRVPCN